ncbi:hypothetical protein ACFSFY_15530 [Sporosarcina siberiensis]|uniref:Nucleotide kinase n=1 Tax=Sporosarcina siberiensis TaxID=1365606 RepID=A0ABW4SJC8_9BACL
MYGVITQYMGTAYTGQGISHKYDELIAFASKTVFIKCPPTNSISKLLNETGSHYLKLGFNIDRFMDPTNPDQTDAIFVKGPNLLFVQASHPVALEPTDIGVKHKVISFYDMYDENKLKEKNQCIVKNLAEAERFLKKALKSLSEAKIIHDEWETFNIERMMWELHENTILALKDELFNKISLNKKSTEAHRLIGSLTSGGACDFIPSITQKVERRILIKGLPGTGKSTLMKALALEAKKRGIDVLYGWCGLDPNGVDLILFPELSVCLIDATKPHAYNPERPGDEILDLVHMCAENEVAEEKVREISEQYSEKMLDSTGYMQAYAQANNKLKTAMDSAIKQSVFEEKSRLLMEMF